MGIKTDMHIGKLNKRCALLEAHVVDLRKAVISLTKSMQLLTDSTQGLEAVFTAKVEKMVEENLTIEIEYEDDLAKLKEYLEK